MSSFYSATGRTYDVDSDGKRFLLVKPFGRSDVTRPSIVVVSHWLDDVRAGMSPGREMSRQSSATEGPADENLIGL